MKAAVDRIGPIEFIAVGRLTMGRMASWAKGLSAKVKTAECAQRGRWLVQSLHIIQSITNIASMTSVVD